MASIMPNPSFTQLPHKDFGAGVKKIPGPVTYENSPNDELFFVGHLNRMRAL